MATITPRTWDVPAYPALPLSRSASTTPVLSRRRGQFHSNHISERSDTPFPRQSSSRESLHDIFVDPSQRGPTSAQRRVRRKKSSINLRNIFFNGDVVPPHSEPSPNESS